MCSRDAPSAAVGVTDPRSAGVGDDEGLRAGEGPADGARCSVLTAVEPVASQCERAVAMPRTCTLLSLLSLCAVCACVAVVPPSFRSANMTAATLLAADKYGKTVLAGDGIAVTAQEYADSVVFRVQARTRGYVALGFAESAAAPSVDVLLLWADDETGTGHILVSPARASKYYILFYLFHSSCHTLYTNNNK